MNHSIIFLHLPKNGGTTFHSILNRLYHGEKIFSLKYDKIKSNKQEFIDLPIEERLQYRILKGHAPFGLHKHMNSNTKYVTFLRKPENRIPSFYYYVLSKPRNKLHNQVVDNKMSIADFVQKINSPDVNNCQVRWISGINDSEDLMLEKAIENIEKYFSFVGLTERYDESLLHLKEIYHWSIPYYKTKNKRKGKAKKIDSEVINLINEYNEYDNILYEYVENNFDKKLKVNQLYLWELNFLNWAYSNPLLKGVGGYFKRSLKSLR